MNPNRPVYLKLRDQIAAAIIDGVYAEGAMLPSVRMKNQSCGIGQFFIQKLATRGGSIGKIMPPSGAIFVRNMRPRACSSGVRATSILNLWTLPADVMVSGTVRDAVSTSALPARHPDRPAAAKAAAISNFERIKSVQPRRPAAPFRPG